MKYRLTVISKQVLIIEGEGDADFVKGRVEELQTGYLSEAEKEVSSFRRHLPTVKVEALLSENEKEELWGEVSFA